jgi:hypothetical protein
MWLPPGWCVVHLQEHEDVTTERAESAESLLVYLDFLRSLWFFEYFDLYAT